MQEMAIKQLTEMRSLFAKFMFTPGSETFGNGAQSAKKAGYSGNSNTLRQRAHELVTNSNIIAVKHKIQAETMEELNITKQGQLDKLAVFHDIALKQKNVAAGRSVIHEENELCGLLQDKAPNTEREQAKLALMDSETRRVAYELALLLTRRRSVEASSVPVKGLKHEEGSKHALLSEDVPSE